MSYIARLGEREIPVSVRRHGSLWRVKVGEREMEVDAFWDARDLLSLLMDGRSYQVDVHVEGDRFDLLVSGDHFSFELLEEGKALLKRRGALEAQGVQEIRTAMPGKVVRVLVAEGDSVEEGAGLVVVEAMKMENEIRSPKAGTVKRVNVSPGEAVEAGGVLLVVE